MCTQTENGGRGNHVFGAPPFLMSDMCVRVALAVRMYHIDGICGPVYPDINIVL